LNQNKSFQVHLHIFAHELIKDLIEIGASYNVYKDLNKVGIIKITESLIRLNMDNTVTNQQLIHTFYGAFAQKDYATMQHCYADTVIFNDAVFKNLNSTEVKAMWEMLCKRGKDLHLEFKNIKATEKAATAYWEATYTFTATGRKVTNRINANFEIENGKIVKHTDSFNFYAWVKQAFGITGILLGNTSFFKNKVHKTAMQNLKAFIEQKH
jgi:limonene-1,2-epoxide hydrolase